jgi:Sensors of blue-light using FAD
MLVRLVYASRAVDDVSQEQLLNILSQSKVNNPESGITGVLCSSGSIFLQCLEGGRMQVNALYNQIAADPRHSDVVILSYEEISERNFSNWSMGVVNLEQVNPSLLLKYSETATLDPYRVSGTASMALLHELMARASIMGQSSHSPSGAR